MRATQGPQNPRTCKSNTYEGLAVGQIGAGTGRATWRRPLARDVTGAAASGTGTPARQESRGPGTFQPGRNPRVRERQGTVTRQV